MDVESAPSKVQMELVDLQCSDELKSRFAAFSHADFWRKHILPTKRFPGLVDNTLRTVAAFDSTYCCEQLFSRMKLTKSKFRAQLTDSHLNDVLLLYLFHLLHQTFHLLVRRSSIKFHID